MSAPVLRDAEMLHIRHGKRSLQLVVIDSYSDSFPTEARSGIMESAIDEREYGVGIDPLELRVKNHAHVHPEPVFFWKRLPTMCASAGSEHLDVRLNRNVFCHPAP
jgi:hypothetical protein